ncbi:hypothetical protein J3A83DRAFT_4188102 [Scleroderma citrinum]
MQTARSSRRQPPKQCRLLVVGKTGVGKSSLINRALNIEEAVAVHDRRGSADIFKELFSPRNPEFIVHDSQGFEPGENKNLPRVQKFIRDRRSAAKFEDQIHAVWLCYQIPLDEFGQRVLEGAMQEFARTKAELLGTKTRWVDDRKEYTQQDVEKKAKEYIQEQCIRPILKFTGEKDIPFVAVSAKVRYNYKLPDLIKLTKERVF